MEQVDKTKEPSPCLKVLVISTVGLGYEGITSVILNNVRAMDRTGLEIHIAETIRVEEGIRKQFEDIGCRMVRFPDRKKETLKYFRELTRYIRKNHIDAVHANGNSATLSIEMLAATLGGCKRRIAHSHNTRCDQVRADKLLRPLFYRLYTDAVACGNDAGRWLFEDRPFTVVKNGRDIAEYRYDPEIRNKMRNRLGIGDAPVFAHVGGFVPQKNHGFLIEIFSKIAQKNKEALFFCVGDGPLRNDVERRAEELGISDRITFTGIVDNVNEYLQAFDVMLLPSLFEGLPLVTVEWQISGLMCIISDAVSDECVISDSVYFLPLNSTAAEWADTAVESAGAQNRSARSASAVEQAEKMGYDIADCSACLRTIYLNGSNSANI